MSSIRLLIVIGIVGIIVAVYYGDLPRHVVFERVKVLASAVTETGATEMRVKLSNHQEHEFTVEDVPKTPRVNNMICVDVKRGWLTRRLDLEMVMMEECPLPIADTPPVRSKRYAQPKTTKTNRVMRGTLPTVGKSLNSSR